MANRDRLPSWLRRGELYRCSDPQPAGTVGASRLRPCSVELLAKPGGVKPYKWVEGCAVAAGNGELSTGLQACSEGASATANPHSGVSRGGLQMRPTGIGEVFRVKCVKSGSYLMLIRRNSRSRGALCPTRTNYHRTPSRGEEHTKYTRRRNNTKSKKISYSADSAGNSTEHEEPSTERMRGLNMIAHAQLGVERQRGHFELTAINPPGRHNTQIWALLLEFLYSLPFTLQGRT